MSRQTPIPPGGNPKDHPAITGGHAVIISGEKPIYKQFMQGPQGHAALGQILDRGGFDYEPVSGKYSGEKQPGYIVHVKNDDEDEKLKDIAKRMGQEAIVHSEAGQHQYVYTAGDNEGQATQPASGVNWFGNQEPDDNYTTLYGPGGEPLGHFSYNIDFEHPLVPHGRGPMVDAPEAAKMVLKSAVEAYRGILLDLRKREMEKADKFAPGIAVAPGVKVKPSVAQALAGMKRRDATAAPTKPKSGADPWDALEPAPGRSRVLPAKKYEVEAKRAVTHGPQPVSHDISAQGFAGRPTDPNNALVTGGGPLHHIQPGGHNGAVTHKNETDYRERGEGVRRREHEEVASVPMITDPNRTIAPQSGRVPTIAEERAARKTEKPMKLHELMKAQIYTAQRAQGGAVSKMEPLEKPPTSEAQRRAMRAAASGHSTLGIPQSVGKDFADADKGGKLPETKKAEYRPTPSYQASRDVSSPHSDGSSLAPNRASHPFSDPARPTTGGTMKSEESPKDRTHGPRVTKNSIFKRVTEMTKGEVAANGGAIKLGKQEFYIDLGNASDPKKRLRETNPVKEAVVPGGKETGWKTDGPKPKSVERPASGGTISKNPPKAGPDQKNAPENSAVTGTVPKSSGKNDLIEKAAMRYHARANPNGGMAKAMPSMAAPKPPQAPGAGSPTLSAKPTAKPPMAPAGGKPMGGFGKALMPFTAQKEEADKAPRGMAPAAGGHLGAPGPGPKPQARAASDYDPSLYQPSGPVSSGLELAGPPKAPPGTGVTPRAAAPLRSPATLKGFQRPMAKAELCKGCGKIHKAGQCG